MINFLPSIYSHHFLVGDYHNKTYKVKKPYMKHKKNLIFWLVSHCETDNKREDYARELMKYVKVDIYGKCDWKETLKVKVPDGQKAYYKYQKKYKFYLAFENSNCYDYISEKFFRTLGKGLIPIVMGRSSNYKKFAPPNSYIDVHDFKSPKELANYLTYLDENKSEYLKYFDWIGKYGLYKQSNWCQLCAKLNNVREPVKTYSNITDWWTHDLKKNLACDV